MELAVLFAAVALGGLYAWRRSKRPKKQCPECGAYCDVDDDVCVHCGYRFATA
ncbi:MAG: hypothetical protein RMA76_05485 [Deltaproteobacteria bacterium]